MTGIPLFVAEATGTCRLGLRRFCYRDEPGGHGHDVTVIVDENAPSSRGPDGRRTVSRDLVEHPDPRWPSHCACGYRFTDADEWQCPETDWYEGSGQRFAWGTGSWDGPAGAMIRSPWRDYEGRPAAWMIFLPNGSHWNTNDRAARDGNQLGPYWDITGTAPLLTVHPSIDDRDPARPWHGWIRDGQLVQA